MSSRRTSFDIAVQMVGRLVNLLLGAVVTLAVVRVLGDEGFGEWSTMFSVIGLAGYLGNFGLDQVAVRRAAADPEHELEWVGALIALRTALGFIVAVVSLGAIALLADSSEMLLAGAIISATLPLNGPRAIRALFQLRVRNDLEVLGITVNSVVWGGAVLFIAATDAGIVELAVAFLAAAVLHAVLSVALGLRLGRPKFKGSARHWPELARVGIPIGIAGVITIAYASIDQILVFEIAGDREAGLYGAAYRLLEQAHFVPISFMTTLFPIIAAAYPVDMSAVRGLVQSTADYLAMASLPALAFAIAAAGPLIRLLFGDEFDRAAAALPVLMAAFVLIAFGYLAGNLIVVLELQRAFVYYALAALVFNVVLNLVLIPPYGFMAAAWVTLLTEMLVLTLSARAVLGRLDMRFNVGRLARTLAAAALMGLAVFACRSADLPLGVLVAVSALSYPALLLGLRVVDRAEIADLLRRRAPRTAHEEA